MSATPESDVDAIVTRHIKGDYDHHVTYTMPLAPYDQVVFGCNLVGLRQPSTIHPDSGYSSDIGYTFLASPIEGDASTLPKKSQDVSPPPVESSWIFKNTVPSPDESTCVEKDGNATADWSYSFAEGACNGSFSEERIEDSFEKIDALEEETEAIRDVIRTVQGPSSAARRSQDPSDDSQSTQKTTIMKRVTIAGQSATLRIKPSEKVRPALRRASSMTLRDQKPKGPRQLPVPESKTVLPMRSKPNSGPGISITPINKVTTSRSAPSSSTPIKSTKPPTIPSFELPGEAVSRRLKEQRAAREARQAEAQKAAAAAAKPKVYRPTKPNFELPGEAISRRKREEQEAKLKAQEEEERKKREFKSRPYRHSMAPSTLVRDTATSRARQGKSAEEPTSDQRKRLARASIAVMSSPIASHAPRRNVPKLTSSEETSRHTRSIVSPEDVAQQRARGRDIYIRDNSYTADREQGRREREAAIRQARDLAAERSRAAGREWAERKVQREQALRDVMRAGSMEGLQ